MAFNHALYSYRVDMLIAIDNRESVMPLSIVAMGGCDIAFNHNIILQRVRTHIAIGGLGLTTLYTSQLLRMRYNNRQKLIYMYRYQ